MENIEDLYQQMGELLRTFLSDFQEGKKDLTSADAWRRKGRKILHLAKKSRESQFAKEAAQLVKTLEEFLSRPSEELARTVVKSALHLEQETREI